MEIVAAAWGHAEAVRLPGGGDHGVDVTGGLDPGRRHDGKGQRWLREAATRGEEPEPALQPLQPETAALPIYTGIQGAAGGGGALTTSCSGGKS